MKLTKEQIDNAKRKVPLTDPHHEHNDCIKMAYEWLDAQNKTKGRMKLTYALKHLIEKWCGRYVSKSDVQIAAYLHPEIKGKYPHYYISSKLVEPSVKRLEGINEAFKHTYNDKHDSTVYKVHE